MNSLKFILMSISLLFGLNACGMQHKYTPPTTMEGVACVMTCRDIKRKCDAREYKMRDAENNECKKSSSVQYKECLENARIKQKICIEKSEPEYYKCLKYSGNPKNCAADDCEEIDYCYENGCHQEVNLTICKENFRQCYEACGGTVELLDENSIVF